MGEILRGNLVSDSHLSHDRFNLFGGDHLNSIPGATIEKGPVGPFAGALLAANTEKGIDLDVTKGRMIFIGDPEHTIFHWTIGNASR